jgi:hypothetical protein
MTTYLLKPRVPGGAWLSVVMILAGAVMTVFGLVGTDSRAWRVAGVAVGLLGLILVAVIVVALHRRRVWVTFDDEGYTVESSRGEFAGSWIDLTDIAVSRKSAKIALWHGPKRRTIIAHPGRVMDDEFMRVRDGIRAHLEALHR